MATTYSGTTPKHLWIAGILSLLWNGYGAYDYLMTELDPVGYLSGAGFGPEVVAWFESFPAWTIAAWAVGVWASVAGAVLLLLRSRHAVTAFLLSLVGALVSFGYQFTSDRPAEVAGSEAMIMRRMVAESSTTRTRFTRGEAPISDKH